MWVHGLVDVECEVETVGRELAAVKRASAQGGGGDLQGTTGRSVHSILKGM